MSSRDLDVFIMAS